MIGFHLDIWIFSKLVRSLKLNVPSQFFCIYCATHQCSFAGILREEFSDVLHKLHSQSAFSVFTSVCPLQLLFQVMPDGDPS